MISKELQEVMAAIERLNPEWQVVPDGDWSTLRFSKDTEDGTYEGEIGCNNRETDVMITVAVSNKAGKTTFFSKGYTEEEEGQHLTCYVRTRIKEILEEATDRFFGR